ncbi:N-acylneuraminate-9-phosphate synthase [Candidatus Symbiopectobacterium sp. 'North America']|uniref:N-acetylneuraminate synthase family protein n=1 Tax=Candidatus Symbiopectobacterium sp. 'North America' TaxID=2794574 RepID=UPI0018CA404E|nr:N-acetylneuraminate synthase family protein [Candidatus Symbiopectobacterium sp. 'North America']MBG6245345.1 N-acylneuraminate-9-phosphate synthase [Candidatus Symbiopectobacterium sp. 'North America']
MPDVLLKDGKCIGSGNKPYFIAEVNSSHNGDIEIARKMIDSARMAGCDCVKFQSWSADSLYSKNYYDSNPIAKRIISKFSLAEIELLELAKYCQSVGIAFASTPYSRHEVDFLVDECGVPFIKVASQDVNNYPYLKYIASKQVPIILSTGMADIEEVRKAVDAITSQNNQQIILLHCVSIYPAAPETINLNNIVGLKALFKDYPVGFSDHTLGVEIPTASIALGATVIEKHLTLDKTKMGMDNNMAIEPDEMKQLVDQCNNVYLSMGSETRVVSVLELAQREKMRRSVVFIRDLPAGHQLQIENFDVKRPGTGLAPEWIEQLAGYTLKKDVKADNLVSGEDIVEKLN